MSLEEAEARVTSWRLVRGDAEALRTLTQPELSKGYVGKCLSFFGLTWPQIRISLQLSIACLAGLMFVVSDRLWELFDHDGMWILVTIAVCTESTAGASLRKGILRLWGTMFGGIASFAILFGNYYFLGPHDFTEHRRYKSIVYLFSITSLMSVGMLCKLKYPKYDYGWAVFIYTIPIVTMPSYREDGVDNFDALSRVACVAVGVTISSAVSLFVFPVLSLSSLQSNMVQSLSNLIELIEKSGKAGIKAMYVEMVTGDALLGTQLDPTDPTELRKSINNLDEKVSAALAKMTPLLDFAEREWDFSRPSFWNAGDFPRDECTRAILALRGLLHMSVSLSYTVATCIVLPAHTLFHVTSASNLQEAESTVRLSIDMPGDGPLLRRILCNTQSREGGARCDHKSMGLVMAAWQQITEQQCHALLVLSRVSKGVYRSQAARMPVEAVRRHLEVLHMVSKALAQREAQEKLSACDALAQEAIASLWGPLSEMAALMEGLCSAFERMYC